MSDKNCMFQYATRHRILADTDLITLSEAQCLFNKNTKDFKERLSNGEEPEMCIWINCKTDADHNETLKHWHHEDMKVFNGELWVRAD